MKTWTMSAALTMSALLLAACGGGNGDAAEADAGTNTASAAPAAPAAAQDMRPDYVADPGVKPPAKPDDSDKCS